MLVVMSPLTPYNHGALPNLYLDLVLSVLVTAERR